MDTKVYLLQGGLPFYKDFVEHAPKGVYYLNKNEMSYEQSISTYYSSKSYNIKRRVASFLLSTLKIPIMNYVPTSDADLIHSNRGILILNRKPWIMDVDYVGYFFGDNMFNKQVLEKSYMKSIIKQFLISQYCKKIICWSNAGQKSICNVFKSDNIIDKTEVLYPAVFAMELKKRVHDKVRILYISSSFENKGGYEVLLAFKILLNTYNNIELIFKCDVSKNIRSKFNFREIKYFPYRTKLLPREKLIEEFHMVSDIFVYPTFGDLFGLSLLDAMVVKMPILTTKTFAIPEIVEEGKNGLLIEPPHSWHNEKYLPHSIKDIKYSKESRNKFISELVDKLSILIEDTSLREKMGKNGRSLVETGKFSINQRNYTLKRIYEEAIK